MRWSAAVILAACASVLVTCGTASAHSGLESSDPADGATLGSAPSAIVMTFTEPPDPSLSTVTVLDAGGASVRSGVPQAYGDQRLRVSLPVGLDDGTYTVDWRVVSAADGHVTAGAFSFGIGVAPTAPPGQHAPEGSAGTVASPSALSVVAKALLYLGVMLVVASAIVGLGTFRGRVRGARIVVLVGALLAVIGAVAFVVSTRREVGVSMSALLSSSTGRPIRALLLAVLVAASLAMVWLVTRRSAALWLAAAAAAAAMLARVDGGHASAGEPAWVQEALQWLHFLAAATWAGGLVLLALFLRERSSGDAPDAQIRRYSNVAVASIGVVAVTGLVRSVDELGGFGRLPHAFSTSYGTTLAIKLALAVAIVTIGAVNRFRTIPRLGTDARLLRRLVAVEVLGVVGILALTATLTGLAPPVSAAPAEEGPPALVKATGSDFATTTTVEFEAAPGTAGPNDFLVLALRYGAEVPVAADGVTLRFASVTHPDVAPVSLPLTANGDTWTGSGTALSLAGTWAVTVQIRSGSTTTEVPLIVTTRAPDGERVTTPGDDGQPTIVTTTYPDGASLQTYVDPGTSGTNQVHVTAFAADGTELALRDAVLVAIPDGGSPKVLTTEVLSPGHVVANAALEGGGWTFDVVATPATSGTMQATWSTTVTAAPAG